MGVTKDLRNARQRCSSRAIIGPMNTLIVMHASVGSGHLSAANSIARTAERLFREGDPVMPRDLRVVVLDILDFGWIRFDGDRATSSFTGVFRPVYDITWRYNLTGRFNWAGGSAWSRLMFGRFTKYIQSVEPLAVVCTHIVAANVAVASRMITGQDFPIVCVPTDYEAEGMWPHLYTNLFCAASESMAETLRCRKVPEERILVTGIPTRDTFLVDYNKERMRKAWKLPSEKTVALILAGANLPRPYIHFRDAIDVALPQMARMRNLQVILVAGQDEEYAEHVRSRCRRLVAHNVTVLGYVEAIAELMAASDVVICKPGGLTVTECLNAQKPMLLVGRAYGQEKINVRMLTSAGAAMHMITGNELVHALRIIQGTPALLDALVVNGALLRRPYAAVDIAHATMFLAQERRPDAFVQVDSEASECEQAEADTDAREYARVDANEPVNAGAESPCRAARAVGGIPDLSEKHFLHFYWGGKPAHNR